MFLRVELCRLFSAGQHTHTAWGCGAQAVVQALGSSTRHRALIMSLTSMNIDDITHHCDNTHENPRKSSPCHFINFVHIHAHQATVTSFVYVFVVVNVVNVLWEHMVWVRFLNAHTCLFVCLLVHTFVCIHVNFHVRMHNNAHETLGHTFINTDFF